MWDRRGQKQLMKQVRGGRWASWVGGEKNRLLGHRKEGVMLKEENPHRDFLWEENCRYKDKITVVCDSENQGKRRDLSSPVIRTLTSEIELELRPVDTG